MAKSKIIKQFVNNEITIKQTLERMLILAKDIKDNNLEKWIRNEIQGYGKSDFIPEYRKIPIIYKGDYETNDCLGFNIRTILHKNATLPTIFLDDVPQNEKDSFLYEFITIQIDMLEQIVKNKNEISKAINPECFSMFAYNDIKILSARKIYDIIYLNQIVEKVRVKIIDILIELEKEFGCLDDLDIDIENKNDKEKQKIYSNINIIIQDNHTENNVKIGDSNTIADSTIANKQK